MLLNNLRQKVILEKQQVDDDKRQKQLDFIQANEALIRERTIKQKSD